MLSRCVILISYIGLSLSTIAVLTSAVALYNLDDYIWKTYDVKSEEAFLYLKTAGLIFLTSFLTINFLNLATCICLIAGALQKRKNFLVPYIILTTLYILIYVALAIWFFVKSSENSLRNGIIAVVVIVVNIYCLIVVHQLYRLLKLREQNYPAFLRETNRQQQQAQNYETTYVKIP